MAKNYFESAEYTARKVIIYMLVSITNIRKWRKVATVHMLDTEVPAFCDQMVKDGMWEGVAVVAINQEGEKIWRKRGGAKVI